MSLQTKQGPPDFRFNTRFSGEVSLSLASHLYFRLSCEIWAELAQDLTYFQAGKNLSNKLCLVFHTMLSAQVYRGGYEVRWMAVKWGNVGYAVNEVRI